MTDLATDDLIEMKVGEFVTAEKGFTSMDICNAIKTDGTWVRNRTVAAWLRRWTAPVGYAISKVTVSLQGGASRQAGVYLPNSLCIKDYAETQQTAMTPAEFEVLHGRDPFVSDPNVPNVVHHASSDDPDDDGGDGSQSTSVGDRLRAMFTWAPGN